VTPSNGLSAATAPPSGHSGDVASVLAVRRVGPRRQLLQGAPADQSEPVHPRPRVRHPDRPLPQRCAGGSRTPLPSGYRGRPVHGRDQLGSPSRARAAAGRDQRSQQRRGALRGASQSRGANPAATKTPSTLSPPSDAGDEPFVGPPVARPVSLERDRKRLGRRSHRRSGSTSARNKGCSRMSRQLAPPLAQKFSRASTEYLRRVGAAQLLLFWCLSKIAPLVRCAKMPWRVTVGPCSSRSCTSWW